MSVEAQSESYSRRSPQVRVIVADDHPVVRIGVRNVLAAHGSFLVLGEAESGEETIRMTLDMRPDIVLLDVHMPESQGFDVIRRLTDECPDTRVVLLTGAIQSSELADAFVAGAKGIVLKSALTEQIASALRAVIDGCYWAQGHRIEHLAGVLNELRAQARQESADRFNLTRRELEVVALIVRGFSNRDIAKHFNLSEETVKRHLSNTFEKLGVSTRLELAIFAIANKLVPSKDAPSASQ